ncbi:phenylalanine--tRNA ligase subunit alpha [bacterium]|nr:phenylalanine--tRNA ligase subunit alpha [bacterium]
MNIDELEKLFKDILQNAQRAVSEASQNELNDLRTKFLGRKGEIAQSMKLLGKLSQEDRPKAGKIANQTKAKIESFFRAMKPEQKLLHTKNDYTLPGRKNISGGSHPIRLVMREIIDIFYGMGFSVASGPEIETEYYNFDALNTPADHPARDIQDTFYLPKDGYLLRTQTSPVQIRVMESQKPPLRVIVPGKCYRKDAIDPTHYYTFSQCEGLYVDKDVNLADLMGVLTAFAKKILGENVKVRFRPHYFPFTEPSLEYDFSCPVCNGKGCRICKGTGWIEISGAGMVDPKVFENVGYDTDKYQGFAWGMGIERIAMVKYGIDDIRLLYENDLAFLEQFPHPFGCF